jgi:hypothetical protein
MIEKKRPPAEAGGHRDDRARADRIMDLAEAAISDKSGWTDITDIPDDELLARYQSLSRLKE